MRPVTLSALGLESRQPASFYAFAAAQPCIICGTSPVQLHHVEDSGRSRRAHALSTLTVVPLCHRCHQTGRDATHNRGKRWQQRHGIDIEARRLDLYRRYARARGWKLPAGLDAEAAAAWIAGQEGGEGEGGA